MQYFFAYKLVSLKTRLFVVFHEYTAIYSTRDSPETYALAIHDAQLREVRAATRIELPVSALFATLAIDLYYGTLLNFRATSARPFLVRPRGQLHTKRT